MHYLNFMLLSASNVFNVTSILIIVGLLLLLLFSAFFSASEIAFSSSSLVRIKTLAEQNVKGSRKALYIADHFNNALSTILVGNNFVNILSTTLCAYLFANTAMNPVVYNIVNTVVMTIVILIFGEILPKALAKSNPEKASLILAPFLYVLMKVLYVICIPFNLMQKALNKKIEPEHKPTVTEDELDNIVETMQEEGVIEEGDADIIHGAIKIGDISVKDVMTPRVDVVCVSSKSSIEEIKKTFLKTQFSRIPVYDKSKDNIIGILNQKNFFSALVGKVHINNINNLLTPALFVSKTAKINDVMKLMQKEQKHMAIVTDEYGGTSGVVTMEDCFEEVFGEVYDEHDDIVNTISKIDENKYRVNAELSVEELFDFLQIEKMPKEKYSNLASFLCSIDERVPQQNKVINYVTIDEIIDDDSKFIKKEVTLSFKLIRVEKRRIREVELTIIVKDLEE